MGKKRIATKSGEGEGIVREKGGGKNTKRHVEVASLYVQSSFNNTKVLLTDTKGNALFSSSSGSLGFSGAKKGTPFAAAKVGELVGDKAIQYGVKEVAVLVKGIGSGRESSIRAFSGKGVGILSIRDITPVPFNGPKAKKPRRV